VQLDGVDDVVDDTLAVVNGAAITVSVVVDATCCSCYCGRRLSLADGKRLIRA